MHILVPSGSQEVQPVKSVHKGEEITASDRHHFSVFTIITHATGILFFAFGDCNCFSSWGCGWRFLKQAGRGCHPNSASEPGWKNEPGLEQELRGELDSKCPQLKALLISPIRNNWIKLCASKMGFFIYVVYCFLQSLEQHLAYNGHLIYAGQTKQSINTAISKFSKKIEFIQCEYLDIFSKYVMFTKSKIFLLWKTNIWYDFSV